MNEKISEKFINKIVLGDSRNLLNELEDNSIDLVLTDPPYFLDKLDENWKYAVVSNKRNQYTVKSLPAGMKFDPEQGRRFYDWYLEISKQIYRILKPGGFFLSFSSPRLYHRMASAIDDAGLEVRDAFLWLYTQNQVKAMSLDHFIAKLAISESAKEKLRKKLEGWKTPQIKSCYEPIAVGQKPPSGTFLQNMIDNEVGLFNTRIKVGNNMFPSNVMTVEAIAKTIDKYFLIPKPSKQEKGHYNTHMTVKPVALCEHLIALSTYAKDAIILDPFVGSGTTAIAAKHLGKRYIGIDSNKEYVDIAMQRLKQSGNLFMLGSTQNRSHAGYLSH